MYIRIGKRIINAANITDVEIGEVEGVLSLIIYLTGDRKVKLSGEDAERFLEALPTYTPVREGE